MSKSLRNASRLIESVRNMMNERKYSGKAYSSLRSSVENVQLYGPCEGQEKPVAIGDWNDVDGTDIMSRLERALEKQGVECEWCDENYACECGKVFRTEADSFSWKPQYFHIQEFRSEELLCKECALAKLEGNPDAFVIGGADLIDHGYVCIDEHTEMKPDLIRTLLDSVDVYPIFGGSKDNLFVWVKKDDEVKASAVFELIQLYLDNV